MKTLSIALSAGLISCAFADQAAAADAAKFKEKVLYSFCSQLDCADGQQPDASLIDVKGTLYGTTDGGGTYRVGTVFSIDPKTGAETVLHSFCSKNCLDGRQPLAGLIDVKGTLYGTTSLGGSGNCESGCGTVFSIDPNTGAEKVLYSFQNNGADGIIPKASLIEVNGALYGTTTEGGNGDCEDGGSGCGTVFSIDPSTGAETVLYSFCSQKNCTDGASPSAGLIKVAGILYGTTFLGGSNSCGGNGCGTVFSIDPSTGAEAVVYSFCGQKNCTDGTGPLASLINVKGTLYGTTAIGGTNGSGTVFALDPNTGVETVVYSFCNQPNCTDGLEPYASLINVKGTLYGTTLGGGAHNDLGTAFALDLNTGTEKVLYSFCGQQNCTDGVAPITSVIDVKGTLYGTTPSGGAYDGGTVFALEKKR